MGDYRLENLSFTYEGQALPTLQNVNALIPQNKITLLSGESGSGKSTLIETILHIAPEYHPGKATGRFIHDDDNWETATVSVMGNRAGLVFQNPDSQFCTYTVVDELAFALENIGAPEQLIETHIEHALKATGIAHLRERTLHSLSGGEKQKVAIASILTQNPPLIIFDEPSSNLDPESRRSLMSLITELKEKEHKTILIVEHNLELILPHVDAVILLGQNGSVLFSGERDAALYFLERQEQISASPPPAIPAIEENPTDLANTTEPILVCEHLSYLREEKPALKDINLKIYAGEMIAVIGPNGAGKTTLLHSLLGIYPASRGVIHLCGKPLKKLQNKKWEYAGIAFQNPEWQFVAHTTHDEIGYSLLHKKMTQSQKAERIKKYLEQFGLWEKRSLNPFMLSQGEKRRLSVASMLVLGQRLLFLDEPTAGLDKRNIEHLMALMQNLSHEGKSIVMVSHDIDAIYKYCNRVILLECGEIRFDGAMQSFMRSADADKYFSARIKSAV
jgi:energy-coupling factor transport system ATP-binding protein